MDHQALVRGRFLAPLCLALALAAAACGGGDAPTPAALRTPTPTTPAPTATPTPVAATPADASATLNPRRVHTSPDRAVEIAVEAGEFPQAIQRVVAELEFDAAALSIIDIIRGPFLGASPRLLSQDVNNRTGKGSITLERKEAGAAFTLTGRVFTLVVRAKPEAAAGEHPLTLKGLTIIYADGRQTTLAATTAVVAVSLPPTPTPSATPKGTP
ncbi:MAG: hypothetical protein EXR60_06405 [Dehalococcoidia bacterium]|nr:hypothetical protein [Dehalococcoidia bacterium]